MFDPDDYYESETNVPYSIKTNAESKSKPDEPAINKGQCAEGTTTSVTPSVQTISRSQPVSSAPKRQRVSVSTKQIVHLSFSPPICTVSVSDHVPFNSFSHYEYLFSAL